MDDARIGLADGREPVERRKQRARAAGVRVPAQELVEPIELGVRNPLHVHPPSGRQLAGILHEPAPVDRRRGELLARPVLLAVDVPALARSSVGPPPGAPARKSYSIVSI